MSRRSEVFDHPLRRTMDAVELQAVRSTIRHETRSNGARMTKGLAVLAAIMAGAYFVDSWLRGALIQSYGDTSVVTLAIGAAAIVVLAPQLYRLRLLALRDLDKAEVFRTPGPIDQRGGLHMRLHSDRGHRGHELLLLHGFHDPIDPEFLWRIDFVRTRHGPDLFYILDAQPIRAAEPGERESLNRFLWATRVYTSTD